MSRSGYNDNIDDNWTLIKWRGQVASAIRGKRGQALLRELLASMDSMPAKRLIADELQKDGEYCALGVLGAARGIDLEKLDPEDHDQVAATFGVAHQLIQEIVFQNDEAHWGREFPEDRWERMRAWVADCVIAPKVK